jgi:hypothetical protein
MTETMTLTWKDRMRIERAVWTLDSHLQNLPRKSRISKRRELRVNLRAAAVDVGANEALRRLGNIRTMAVEYLVTEYGGPAPSWIVATYVLFAGYFFMIWLANTRIDAFRSGAIAANPHLTGIFHLSGVMHVLANDTFIFTNGKATEIGATFLPLVNVYIFALAILAGRLWRVVPALRRRRSLVVSTV